MPVDKRDELYEMLVTDNKNGDNLLEALTEMLRDELEWIVSKPKGNVEWARV